MWAACAKGVLTVSVGNYPKQRRRSDVDGAAGSGGFLPVVGLIFVCFCLFQFKTTGCIFCLQKTVFKEWAAKGAFIEERGVGCSADLGGAGSKVQGARWPRGRVQRCAPWFQEPQALQHRPGGHQPLQTAGPELQRTDDPQSQVEHPGRGRWPGSPAGTEVAGSSGGGAIHGTLVAPRVQRAVATLGAGTRQHQTCPCSGGPHGLLLG